MKRYYVAREQGRLSARGRPAITTASGLRWWLVDGRLHRPDGPAVETGNGTSIYYWRGVRVPRHVIENPRARRPDEIMAERNAEVRRAWLECYGLADAMIDLAAAGHACIRHQTTEPRRRLWEIGATDVDGECPVYVEVDCPSTDRTYFLRVPPNMRNCEEAVAWTFGVDADRYAVASES